MSFYSFHTNLTSIRSFFGLHISEKYRSVIKFFLKSKCFVTILKVLFSCSNLQIVTNSFFYSKITNFFISMFSFSSSFIRIFILSIKFLFLNFCFKSFFCYVPVSADYGIRPIKCLRLCYNDWDRIKFF